MKMKLQRSALAGAITAVVGGGISQEASADTLMFPYLAASNTVTTILSVVNHGLSGNDLHYEYYYKNIVGDPAVDQTSECHEFNYDKPTSPQDLVTFDTTGVFGDSEGVMFNDPTNYSNGSSPFTEPMESEKPARAFLLVDDGSTTGAQLYGEAVVMEFATGAAWGYRAYNPIDDNFVAPNFSDTQDALGEVLGTNEFSPFQFMPIDQVITKFLVTPVSTTSQRAGNLLATVAMNDVLPSGALIVAWDRDENPISGRIDQPVVCVAAKPVEELMTSAAFTNLGPKGGWSYLDVIGDGPTATNGAVVYKLEYNRGNTLDGVSITGTYNNALQMTDNGSINTAYLGRNLGVDGTDGF